MMDENIDKGFFARSEKDTHQDANADKGVQIRKLACDGILRRIEKGNGKRANQDRHIEIRDPS